MCDVELELLLATYMDLSQFPSEYLLINTCMLPGPGEI